MDILRQHNLKKDFWIITDELNKNYKSKITAAIARN